MKGGYLTLDFSNIQYNGVFNTEIYLGKKKNLYKYLENNKKPIQIILSGSVCKTLYKYMFNHDFDFKDTLCYAFPSTFLDYDGLGNTPDIHKIFFLIQPNTTSAGDVYMDLSSIHIRVLENDDVYIREL